MNYDVVVIFLLHCLKFFITRIDRVPITLHLDYITCICFLRDNDEHKIIERYCSSLNDTPAHKTNGDTSLTSPAASQSTEPQPRIEISSSSAAESPLRSPMQIVMSLEDNQKTELEAMIKDLEDENR